MELWLGSDSFKIFSVAYLLSVTARECVRIDLVTAWVLFLPAINSSYLVKSVTISLNTLTSLFVYLGFLHKSSDQMLFFWPTDYPSVGLVSMAFHTDQTSLYPMKPKRWWGWFGQMWWCPECLAYATLLPSLCIWVKSIFTSTNSIMPDFRAACLCSHWPSVFPLSFHY